VVFDGVFAEYGDFLWCLSGYNVVECVVNVVRRWCVFGRRFVGQVFWIYFWVRARVERC
jgi:hypothetical protein